MLTAVRDFFVNAGGLILLLVCLGLIVSRATLRELAPAGSERWASWVVLALVPLLVVAGGLTVLRLSLYS